nr:LLM class flavin-dependent oxidoreductase [Halorientalis sp.]
MHENAGYRRLFDGDGRIFGTGFPLTDNRESRPPVDQELAFGTASVVLQHRHPLHVVTGVATLDRLSRGRLALGVATGDRDRESLDLLRTVWRVVMGEKPFTTAVRTEMVDGSEAGPEHGHQGYRTGTA